MKARFVKSMMCLVLSGALLAGEAGTALAAAPVEVTEEESAEEVLETVETPEAEEAPEAEEVPEAEEAPEAEEVPEAEEAPEAEPLVVEEAEVSAVKAADVTPSVTSYSTGTNSSSRRQNISFEGYGSKFEIYVNNVLWAIYNNDEKEWDDEAGEYVQASAPYFYSYDYFYDMIPGVTYNFKIVPYNSKGTAGTAKTFSGKVDMPSINSITASVYGSTIWDEDGTTTGYRKPYVSLSCNVSDNNGYAQKYEIYRAEGKKTAAYKKVDETTSYASSYFYWYDYNIKVGTKYYYKVRAVSGTDPYVAKPVTSAYSKIVEASIGKPAADCNVYYEEGMVSVYAANYGYSSGFEVYRSTSKTKGYKKIATISDTSYTDKNIKSGSTYYYKLKPFYYDSKTKKKYTGNYSEPAGVKILLGSIYLETQQTAANKVKLTWDKVSGAKSYEIYYKSNMPGDAYKYLTTTGKLSYTAKLSANTGYSFQIRACKEAGNVKSYYQSAGAYINLGFKAPENFRITKKSVSVKSTSATIKSTLKWDRVYGAKSYRIEAYDTEAGARKTLKTLKSSATSYEFKNTVTKGKGAKYSYVYIYAVNGNKEESSSLSEYVEDNKYGNIRSLANVTGVKVKRKSSTSAQVTWKKVTGADTYRVYRQAPTGEQISLGTVKTNSFTDKKLTPGVNYIYSVTAENLKLGIYESYGYGANSAVYNHKLGATSISSVKNVSGKKAAITWKKAAYAQQYVVYRSTSKNGTYKKVATVKSNKTNWTDSKLSKGKTYYYKVEVRAVNDAGLTVISGKSGSKAVSIRK